MKSWASKRRHDPAAGLQEEMTHIDDDAAIGEDKDVEGNTNTKEDGKQTEEYRKGYLYHWSSKKQVCIFTKIASKVSRSRHRTTATESIPEAKRTGAKKRSESVDALVLMRSSRIKDNPFTKELQVQFHPVLGAGHFGYIQQVGSDKIVHPDGEPEKNTEMILHENEHAGALFGFDEVNLWIRHRNGLVWCPYGDANNPGDGTSCTFTSEEKDYSKFYFGDKDGNPMSPYPGPTCSDGWKIVKAFLNPMVSHSFQVKYKTGKIRTKTKTVKHAWDVNIGITADFAKLGGGYSGFVEKLASSTWSGEKEETTTITVPCPKEGGPGDVVVWQYVFYAKQYDDEFTFQSPIIANTASTDKPPEMPVKKEDNTASIKPPETSVRKEDNTASINKPPETSVKKEDNTASTSDLLVVIED